MGKIRPGQFPTAAEWNRHVDVSEWWHGRRLSGNVAADQIRRFEPVGTTALIKNTTGATVDRGYVLGITGVEITPTANLSDFLTQPVLTGSTPSASTVEKWALLLEPIKAGGIGRGLISGIGPAYVSIGDTSHNFVQAQASDTQLASATSGVGQLIYQESGTGDKHALIRMGQGASPPADSTAGLITIKNNTGSDAEKYQILGIGASLENATSDLAAFQTMPHRFDGDYANDGSPGDWGHWCVLQEDIDDGQEGLAMIQGITPVQIDQGGYEDLPFVDVNTANDDFLAMCHWHGRATLLDTSQLVTSPTTMRWGIIEMHEYRSPIYRATANGVINSGSSNTCEILDDRGFTGDATVTVYNNWMEGTHNVAASDELLIRFNRDQNQWQIVSAEC